MRVVYLDSRPMRKSYTTYQHGVYYSQIEGGEWQWARDKAHIERFLLASLKTLFRNWASGTKMSDSCASTKVSTVDILASS